MNPKDIEQLLESSKRPVVKPSDTQKTRMLNQIMTNAPKAAPVVIQAHSEGHSTIWSRLPWLSVPVIGVGALAAFIIIVLNQPTPTTQVAVGNENSNGNVNTNEQPTNTNENTNQNTNENVNENTSVDNATATSDILASTKYTNYLYLTADGFGGGYGYDISKIDFFGGERFSTQPPIAELQGFTVGKITQEQARSVADIVIGSYVNVYTYTLDWNGNTVYTTKSKDQHMECRIDLIQNNRTARCMSLNAHTSTVDFTAPESEQINQDTAIQMVSNILDVPISELQIDVYNEKDPRDETKNVTVIRIMQPSRVIRNIPYQDIVWHIAMRNGYMELLTGVLPAQLAENGTYQIISPQEAYNRVVSGFSTDPGDGSIENVNFSRLQVSSREIMPLFAKTENPQIDIHTIQLEYTRAGSQIVPVYRVFGMEQTSQAVFEITVDASVAGDIFIKTR